MVWSCFYVCLYQQERVPWIPSDRSPILVFESIFRKREPYITWYIWPRPLVPTRRMPISRDVSRPLVRYTYTCSQSFYIMQYKCSRKVIGWLVMGTELNQGWPLFEERKSHCIFQIYIHASFNPEPQCSYEKKKLEYTNSVNRSICPCLNAVSPDSTVQHINSTISTKWH